MSFTTPAMTQRHGLLGPIAAASACICGAAVLAMADPETTSWYPGCPLYESTGVWCPGCGLTRAFGLVVRGRPIEALGANLWWPLVAVVALTGWWAWVRRSRGDRFRWWVERVPLPAWGALVGLIMVFTVLRNLPGDPWSGLAP